MATNHTRGRPSKRADVLAGARTVFARDGYARASIDAVAAAAGVSPRTIYAHFPRGKEQLFGEVLVHSATTVADRFRERVEATVTGVDVTTDLVAIGHAFVAQRADSPEHFELVARIQAERDHFPPEVVAAWQDAGPMAVRREIADRLTTMPGLTIDDPELAAAHLGALVAAVRDGPSDALVDSAVRVFLDGYHAR